MKNIILMVVLLILNLEAQDRLNPTHILDELTVPNASTNFNFNANEDHFVKGWNWGGQPKQLDESLSLNFNHCGTLGAEQSTWGLEWRNRLIRAQNQNLILTINGVSGGDYGDALSQAMSMQFEPSYNFDYSYPYLGDLTGAIAGFIFRENAFNQNLSGNYSMQTSIFDLLPFDSVRVLSNLSHPDELLDITNINGIGPHKDSVNNNGRHWFLSIRLKALETIDATNASDTILSIKMPYVTNRRTYKITPGTPHPDTLRECGDIGEFVIIDNIDSTGLISFNEIPATDLDPGTVYDVFSERPTPELVGTYRLQQPQNPARSEYVFITGEMIRQAVTDPNQEYITLSAFFTCDPIFGSNPYFQNTEHRIGIVNDPDPRITDLDIVVHYFGNIDVAIDWVRLETPLFREIMMGQYDQEFIDTTQATLDAIYDLPATTDNRPDLRIFRFYGADEFYFNNLGSQRYLNMLLDTNLTTEMDHVANIGEFMHGTQFKEFWTGAEQIFKEGFAVPYIRKSTIDSITFEQLLPIKERFGFKEGYTGKFQSYGSPPIVFERDTLGSTYETFIDRTRINEDNIPIDSVWSYLKNEDIHNLTWADRDTCIDHYYTFNSVQAKIEHQLYKNYYTNGDYLFLNKPWFRNIWSQTYLTYQGTPTKDGNVFFNNTLPRTKEMYNFQNNISIILGAKGLLTWWGSSTSDFPKTNGKSFSNTFYVELGHSDFGNRSVNESMVVNLPSSGDVLINSDTLGGDFFTSPDYYFMGNFHETGIDRQPISNFIDNTLINFDSLNISTERIYKGTRTKRTEMSKLNKWIDHVEDELLDLRLIAWYGKGYKELYRQHPLYGDLFDALENKVNYKDIRTRKIYQPNTDGSFVADVAESIDSAFFDITYLAPSDTTNESFYIGVQNRRTDPLIFVEDLVDTDDRGLQFFSGAEFDDFVNDTGTNADLFGNQRDSSWWQDQWWKRLGAREFTIPFKIRNYHSGKFYLVEELGSDGLEALDWRFGPKYHDLVYDSIVYNGSINFNLLPGEAKILKITPKSVFPFCEMDACDFWNEANYELESELTYNVTGECCYDLKLVKKSSNDLPAECEGSFLPFRLVATNYKKLLSGSAELNGEPFVVTPNGGYDSLYKDIVLEMDSDTINIGNLCIPSDIAFPYHPIFSLHLGDSTGLGFISCDEVDGFKVVCGDSTVTDCCDGLDSTLFTTEFERTSESCCSYVYFDSLSTFNNECFYGVNLSWGSRNKLLFNEDNPIDFSSIGSNPFASICYYYSNHSILAPCTSSDPTYGDGVKKSTYYIDFLGKDGSVICKVPVDVYSCCDYIDYEVDLGNWWIDGGPVELDKQNLSNTNNNAIQKDIYTLMPNPNQGEFELSFEIEEEKQLDIAVYNTFGKKIFSIDQRIFQAGEIRKQFNLLKLSNGAYYLNIRDVDKLTTIPFVIKK
ncbi:T9SS type A sorting domain-containing protein [Candidatus Kapabacteria bacterium]|nr:T9SS type A sorting domain-containing protein [Candidatus Kapabacteria bacterium]